MVNSGSFDSSDMDRNSKGRFKQSCKLAVRSHSPHPATATSVCVRDADFSQTADSVPLSVPAAAHAIEPTATKTEYNCTTMFSGDVGHITSSTPGKSKDEKCPKPNQEGEKASCRSRSRSLGDADVKKPGVLCRLPLDKVQELIFGYKGLPNGKKQITKRLLCLYCDRTFVTTTLRQKHVDRCHSVKQNRRSSSRRFPSQQTSTNCSYCDKLNGTEHSLNELFEHLVSTHSNKYFGCLPCGDRFPTLPLLTNHNATAHPCKEDLKPTEIDAMPQQTSQNSPDEMNGNVVKITRSKKREENTIPKYENDQRTLESRKKIDKLKGVKKKTIITSRELRSKKSTLKNLKIGLKRITRLQSKSTEASKCKKRIKTDEKTEDTKTNEKQVSNRSVSINPYPQFDSFFQVKKITDHSIDNLRISTLTFDDVFDKAFYSRIKCNIQENLLNHIDGKLFKNEESESRISNFEKITIYHQDLHNPSLLENFGCDISLNAATPVPMLLSSQFGEDLESQIEYGSKASKKKVQTRNDEVNYKYFTRRKYQASILESKENRDLSKLDMWTQLIIKNRQQNIANDKKTPKELQDYAKSSEYKAKQQLENLNRILDRRGPFEDLKQEATKKAALDKLSLIDNSINQESFSVITDVLNEIINDVCLLLSPVAVTEPCEPAKSVSTENDISNYLKLRCSSTVNTEEEIDKSDRITLICSSQETENFEAANTPTRKKNELVELTGEWARTKIYVCAACGLKVSNMKQLIEHKSLDHQNVWCQHYEFVGNQSELYRHLSIPALGKVGEVENNTMSRLWQRSTARTCTKCSRLCNTLGELHRHVLECGGDWSWMLARKKYKYRPFGAKTRRKRRGLVKRIVNTDRKPQERKIYKKRFEGPRPKPSDAESIQRMLANLPAKRKSRKMMSLKDGFPRTVKRNSTKISTNTNIKAQRKTEGRRIIPAVVSKKKKKTSSSATNENSSYSFSQRRSLRSVNKVLSSRILDTKGAIVVRKKLKSAMQNSHVHKKGTTTNNIREIPRKMELSKQTRTTPEVTFKSDQKPAARNSKKEEQLSAKIVHKSPPAEVKVATKTVKPEKKITLKTAGNIKNFFPVMKKRKINKSCIEADVTKDVVKKQSDKQQIKHKITPLKQSEKSKKPKLNAIVNLVGTLAKTKAPDSVKTSKTVTKKNVVGATSKKTTIKRKLQATLDGAVQSIKQSKKQKLTQDIKQSAKQKPKKKKLNQQNKGTFFEKAENSSLELNPAEELELDNMPQLEKIPETPEKNDDLKELPVLTPAVLTFDEELPARNVWETNTLSTRETEKKESKVDKKEFHSPRNQFLLPESEASSTSVVKVEQPVEHVDMLTAPVHIPEKTESYEVKSVFNGVNSVSKHPITPKPRNKLKKPSKGLNDCIAMLTSKLQQQVGETISFNSANSVLSLTIPTESVKDPPTELSIPDIKIAINAPFNQQPKIPCDVTPSGTALNSADEEDLTVQEPTKCLSSTEKIETEILKELPSTYEIENKMNTTKLETKSLDISLHNDDVSIDSIQKVDSHVAIVSETKSTKKKKQSQQSKKKKQNSKQKARKKILNGLFDDSVQKNLVNKVTSQVAERYDNVIDDVINQSRDECHKNLSKLKSEFKIPGSNVAEIQTDLSLDTKSAMQNECDVNKENQPLSSATATPPKPKDSTSAMSDSEDELPLISLVKKSDESSKNISLENCDELVTETQIHTETKSTDPQKLKVPRKKVNKAKKQKAKIKIVVRKPTLRKKFNKTVECEKMELDLEEIFNTVISNKEPLEASTPSATNADLNSGLDVKEDESKLPVTEAVVDSMVSPKDVPAIETTDKTLGLTATCVSDGKLNPLSTVPNTNHCLAPLSAYSEQEGSEWLFHNALKSQTAAIAPVDIKNDYKPPIVVSAKVKTKNASKQKKKSKNAKKVEAADKKEFFCDICSKTFGRSDSLVKHMKTLTHIAKLSELEAKQMQSDNTEKTILPVPEEVASVEDINISNILQDSDKYVENKTVCQPMMTSAFTLNTSSNNTLKLADIINDVLNKPVHDGSEKHNTFSNIILQSTDDPIENKVKRCKSLGERKSFESDNIKSSSFTDFAENFNSTTLENNIFNKSAVCADSILEKQISLLENMIENRTSLNYIDDISINSSQSMVHCQSPSDMSFISETRNSTQTISKENVFPGDVNTGPDFIKPVQYEEISEESTNLSNSIEEQRSRKALNRDEELFLECCSLLKSGSEVSERSKRSGKATAILKNLCSRPSNEPDILEHKMFSIQQDLNDSSHFMSDTSRIPTPLGDNLDDDTISNTASFTWQMANKADRNRTIDRPSFFEDISNEDSILTKDEQEKRTAVDQQFSFKNQFAKEKSSDSFQYKKLNGDNNNEESGSVIETSSNDLPVTTPPSPVLKKSDIQNKKFADRKDRSSSPHQVVQMHEPSEDTKEKNLASPINIPDCKKMPTKGALKVFEGLRVSIPTDDLNISEILNQTKSHLVAGKMDSNCENASPAVDAAQTVKEDSDKSIKHDKEKVERKDGTVPDLAKTSKSGMCGKVFSTKLRRQKNNNTKQFLEEDATLKNFDVYDFEETQDNSDILQVNPLSHYRNFKSQISETSVEKNLTTETIAAETESPTNKTSAIEATNFTDSFSLEGNSLSSLSSFSNASAKKKKVEKNVTKKKCMIMGRIFKNALKSKMADDIREIPTIDNTTLVNNYVMSCPSVKESKPKMSPEEMDQLFNQLLGDNVSAPSEDVAVEMTESNKQVAKQNMLKQSKAKLKKKTRNNSESTDDEFSISKPPRKRCNRKSIKEIDNIINLEQELRECIGVASRKSQRKCTSGKQNVLVEFWSSDESMNGIDLESELTPPVTENGKNKEPLESSECVEPKPVEQEHTPNTNPQITKKPKVQKTAKKPKKVPSKKQTRETEPVSKGAKTEETGQDSETLVANRRKRAAVNTLYYWSSSSEDEFNDMIETKPIRDEFDDDDHPIQHGWIVGDSPKKLVTMLAQAKGKKLEVSSVKEQAKIRTSVSCS